MSAVRRRRAERGQECSTHEGRQAWVESRRPGQSWHGHGRGNAVQAVRESDSPQTRVCAQTRLPRPDLCEVLEDRISIHIDVDVDVAAVKRRDDDLLAATWHTRVAHNHTHTRRARAHTGAHKCAHKRGCRARKREQTTMRMRMCVCVRERGVVVVGRGG